MEFHGRSSIPQSEEEMDLRRGPWTVEEDLILKNYIINHGEGRWNSLARCANLRRTGKSCRLRWLNYLRPDVRRGDITPEEQLIILELHSRWGNRWSKIAQHLRGRTDNEIKNYWRTRVQKQAKQLQCDVDSKQFKDVMRYLWVPRLLERIQAASANNSATTASHNYQPELPNMVLERPSEFRQPYWSPDSSSRAGSSMENSHGASISTTLPISDRLTDCYSIEGTNVQMGDGVHVDQFGGWWPELLPRTTGCGVESPGFDQILWEEGITENSLSLEDIWSSLSQL